MDFAQNSIDYSSATIRIVMRTIEVVFSYVPSRPQGIDRHGSEEGPTSRLKSELCPTLLFFSTYIWMRKRPGVGRFEGLGRVGESNIETIAIMQA